MAGERNGPFGTFECNWECDDRLKYKLKIYFYLMKHKMSFRIFGAFNLSKSPLRIATVAGGKIFCCCRVCFVWLCGSLLRVVCAFVSGLMHFFRVCVVSFSTDHLYGGGGGGESWLPCLFVICIWASSRENPSSGFATRVDSNWPAQLQRLARVLKFRL